MSIVAIRKALETRLAALSPDVPTQFENTTYMPLAGTPYQQAFLLPAQPVNPVFGASIRIETGIFQVTLRYPVGNGPGDVAARAEAIRAWFPRSLSLVADGVTVTILRTPEIGRGHPEGDRFVVVVSIPYWSQT